MAEFVRVVTGGSHRDMGFDLGKAVARELVGISDETLLYHQKLAKRSKNELIDFAQRKFLKIVKKNFPDQIDEIQGIADGSNLSFAEVFFLTVDEELTSLWKRQKSDHCSSLAMKRGGRWLLAHNEDYPPRYYGRLVIVDAKPDKAPAFLALSYPYILAGTSCGMNMSGLGFTANSLRFPAKSSGLPTNYILRDLYGATSLDDAERRLAREDALMSNAGIIVSVKEDGARAVELSPHGIVIVQPDKTKTLAQTNHMIGCDGYLKVGEKPTQSSRQRYKTLVKYAPTIRSRGGIERLFSSVEKGLLVPKTGIGESCTIASVVMDVSARTMYVAKRGPNGHGFIKYRMRSL